MVSPLFFQKCCVPEEMQWKHYRLPFRRISSAELTLRSCTLVRSEDGKKHLPPANRRMVSELLRGRRENFKNSPSLGIKHWKRNERQPPEPPHPPPVNPEHQAASIKLQPPFMPCGLRMMHWNDTQKSKVPKCCPHNRNCKYFQSKCSWLQRTKWKWGIYALHFSVCGHTGLM